MAQPVAIRMRIPDETFNNIHNGIETGEINQLPMKYSQPLKMMLINTFVSMPISDKVIDQLSVDPDPFVVAHFANSGVMQRFLKDSKGRTPIPLSEKIKTVIKRFIAHPDRKVKEKAYACWNRLPEDLKFAVEYVVDTNDAVSAKYLIKKLADYREGVPEDWYSTLWNGFKEPGVAVELLQAPGVSEEVISEIAHSQLCSPVVKKFVERFTFHKYITPEMRDWIIDKGSISLIAMALEKLPDDSTGFSEAQLRRLVNSNKKLSKELIRAITEHENCPQDIRVLYRITN